MKKKTFDCVELQDKAGERIHDEQKGMTFEERVAYWKERNRRFLEEIAQAKAKRKTA